MNAHLEEQIILASCIAEGRASVDVVADTLDATAFGDARHARIWRAISGAAISDIVPLLSIVRAVGVGTDDAKYVEELNASGIPRNARELTHYALRVRKASQMRRLAELCRKTADALERTEASDADPIAAADSLVDAALAIGESRTATGARRLQDVAKEVVSTLRERHSTLISGGSVETVGFMSGLAELDAMLDAFQPGHMYLVGGSSGHGKTAFMGHLAMKAAEQRCGVLYATLEMPDVDMVRRFASTTSRVDSRKIANANVEDAEVDRILIGVARWAGYAMHTLDTPAVTVPAIEREVRRTVRKAGAPEIGAVFVDYLQLVRAAGRHGNREQDVAEVADGLLELAKRHHLAVIVGAQLNRANTARSDKRPQTSDLRESSRAEHNATAVLMLYRPHLNGEANAAVNACEIIVRKNRKGPVGTAQCHFDPARNVWADIERRRP